MRVLYIVPGSGGGFYCQNCVRDIGLIQAMHAAGTEVVFLPMYLPSMEMAGAAIPQTPVFYGAVNIYLQQKIPFYRHLPDRWRRLLDSPGVLRWAASKAGTTQAGGLGELTLSMLNGENGRQRGELAQMTAWLKTQPRPDIVHFSNALLLGAAPALRQALGSKIVCSLQDDHTWLDALPDRYRERCWERVRALARTVDLFVPVSDYYASEMSRRLRRPAAQCRTIPVGIDTDAYIPASTQPEPPAIGFLSGLTPSRALDVLVEAFLILRTRPEMSDLQLRVTGGDANQKNPYLKRIRTRILKSGQASAVRFSGGYRGDERKAFLRSLRVLSVPSACPEAFGLFLIEAMACGVPVVQPRIGAYPEIMERTGGGVIYDDLSPAGLAEALYPLLADPALAARYARAGRKAVAEHFTLSRMAEAMSSAYQELVQNKDLDP